MTKLIYANGAVKSSLINIIKHQMIDAVLESTVDLSEMEQVSEVLRTANFGARAIEELSAIVAVEAKLQIAAGCA